MAKRNNSDLFFTCSLVEYIGREKKLQRKDVVNQIGKDGIEGIYDSADVLHCEPIAKIADEVIRDFQVSQGEFDNVALCEYQVPDYWTIGEVYERLIEDVFNEDQIVDGIMEVYNSWIDEVICDYNSDFFYQPRDYIAECYKSGEILE